jgi:serpin B
MWALFSLAWVVFSMVMVMVWVGIGSVPRASRSAVALLSTRRPVPELPPPHRPREVAGDVLLEVVKINDTLAFDLYERLRDRPGNLLMAPAPLTVGLGLVGIGARGQTAAEIARLLHRPAAMDDDHRQRSLAALVAVLSHDGKSPLFGETEPPSPSYQVRPASGLWIQAGYSLGKDYRSLSKDLFGVEDARVDFRADPEGACPTINAWARAQTGGRIDRVITPESLSLHTKLVLAIALYLRASWQRPFLEQSTRNESFRVGQFRWVAVSTMHEHSYVKQFDYFGNETLQALELSCAGGDHAMVILLPRRWNGLAELEMSLGPKPLDSWIKGMRAPEEIDITLPRFLLSGQVSLTESLAKLGMRLAFEGIADFSGINGKSHDLFLSDVLHAATIDVNGKGIEAAATVGYISPDAFGDEPVSFHADHPFVFLIRDKRTGCILFLGRLADPSRVF